MKRITIAALAAAAALTGCTSTKSIVYEYDSSGKVTKKTETTESIVKAVTDSTKDKTVVVWDNSWLAYISGTTATAENPTPTVKMGIGKADKGLLTLHSKHDVTAAAQIIQAARSGELSVTKDGAGSKSAADTTATSTK